jgi:hypothetical protein
MTQYCDCEPEEPEKMWSVRFYNNERPPSPNQIYKCPRCGKERTVDGHGKEVKK